MPGPGVANVRRNGHAIGRHGRPVGGCARNKLELIPTVAEADVELAFDPPWTRAMMSEASRVETGML